MNSLDAARSEGGAAMIDQAEEVAVTSRGHTIWRKPNGAGGYRYYSDSIGGRAMIWDTCIASSEELLVALRCEAERLRAERRCQARTTNGNQQCEDDAGHIGTHVTGTGRYFGVDGIEHGLK